MAPTCLSPRASDSQSMAKSSSGRTLPSFGGRSRTWPKLASTVYPPPKERLMVLAFAGDSTTTTSDMMFHAVGLGSGVRQQGKPVPRQCFHPSGEFQFKEDRHDS